MSKKSIFGIVTLAVIAASAAYAGYTNPRAPIDFYVGHTHSHGETIGAPEHSGGTDAYGCHNGSVPYHCH